MGFSATAHRGTHDALQVTDDWWGPTSVNSCPCAGRLEGPWVDWSLLPPHFSSRTDEPVWMWWWRAMGSSVAGWGADVDSMVWFLPCKKHRYAELWWDWEARLLPSLTPLHLRSQSGLLVLSKWSSLSCFFENILFLIQTCHCYEGWVTVRPEAAGLSFHRLPLFLTLP